MANRLGPIDILCDAPPYSVVKACRTLAMQAPEDVRWFRMSYFLNRQAGWPETLSRQTWKSMLGVNQGPGGKKCSCAHELPGPVQDTLTYITGQEAPDLPGPC